MHEQRKNATTVLLWVTGTWPGRDTMDTELFSKHV